MLRLRFMRSFVFLLKFDLLSSFTLANKTLYKMLHTSANFTEHKVQYYRYVKEPFPFTLTQFSARLNEARLHHLLY